MNSWQESNFEGFDGTPLHYRYHADVSSRDLFLIVHGHGEHSGRYEKFADELKARGLNFAIYDLRGHGRSGGRHVYIDSYEDYLKDLTAAADFFQKKAGFEGPFYLFGHSNGALIALHWAARNPGRVKALFLSSPLLGLRLPCLLRPVNAVLNRLAPGMIYRNPVYPPYLTHNLAEVENYRKDGLIRRKITVRLLAEMLSYSLKIDGKRAWQLPFPVYILMAGLERVVDSAKTRLFFEKLQVPDKGLHVFPDFYHEIFNELGQEQAFDALREFVDRARNLPRKEG